MAVFASRNGPDSPILGILSLGLGVVLGAGFVVAIVAWAQRRKGGPDAS
jgi:hypothetical protein